MSIIETPKEIDPLIWFSERKLEFTPIHFTKTKTSITSESENWILNTLRGRFSLYQEISDIDMADSWSLFSVFPAFEDPLEAVLYELTWC